MSLKTLPGRSHLVTRHWPYLLLGGLLLTLLAAIAACLWGLWVAGEVGR